MTVSSREVYVEITVSSRVRYSRRQKKVPQFDPYNGRARLKKRAANGN